MPAYLELFKLTKAYPSGAGSAAVVKSFSLDIARGEFVCLIGHSGCGKSTVLSMVAGLTPPTHGGVVLDDREVDRPGSDRGVVFQAPCLLPWLTALENVLLGVRKVHASKSAAEQRRIGERALALVGLGDALSKRPRELSQGMQQRVGIARAIALAPKVLLLDEPFGMLDALTRMELQDILLELLDRDRKTALMVTHDVDEALFLADRIVMMTNGPDAGVRAVVPVPFERPRIRANVLEHPRYYELREQLLTLLEEEEHKRALERASARTEAPQTVSL